MDDVSDFFKSGFLSLHKNTIGKNYQQKTLKDRMNNFNNIRRETRNTLIFQKRQIDENMTPIKTPEPTKREKKVAEKKEVIKTNKRLEMLNKWKEEKEKRKQEAQKKAKPLFKVCHVPVEVGLPNLENVNKEIKGKPIKSQFAPPNHEFHAPKNVKPINMTYHGHNTGSLTKTKTETQKINLSKTNTMKSRQNIVSQRNTRSATTRKEQTSKLNEKLSSTPSKKSRIKTEVNKTNPGQDKYILQKTVRGNLKTEEKNRFKPKVKETLQKNISNIDTRKKLQSQNNSVIENNARRDIKCNSPKRNRRDEKTTNKKTLLIDLTSVLEGNNLPKNNEKPKRNISKKLFISNNVETMTEIKKTPKKNNIKFEEISKSKDYGRVSEKKKSLTTLKQPKLKRTDGFSNHTESANTTSKKTVGWNTIEIVDSDDEMFSKAINNRTPRKVTRKYKKTPRKEQNTDRIEDNMMEETLTNEINEKKKLHTVSENNKTNIKTPVQKTSYYSNKKRSSSTMESSTGSASPDYPVEHLSPINISSHTPVKNVSREVSPVYISPFVTVSRGKSSARKEYQVRHSTGGCLNDTTPEFNKDISDNISPKAGADYFTKKLNNEIAIIEGMCDEWRKYKEDNECPEEANDMIDVAIGQSKLLISKKFQQFQGLINECKNSGNKEKPVTCEDLHGFWDMLYMQVEDLNKRFNSLNVLKANNWQEVIPEKKPVVKRGRGRPKKITASSRLKDMIKDARNKKKSNAEGENNLIISQSDETGFSGECYSINSPVKDRKSPTPRSSNVRKSLRVSLLANQDKRRSRMSLSPGLAMMRISQAIKGGDGLTPSKSILKTDLTKSANKIAKSVLFKDDLVKHIKSTKASLFKNVVNGVNKENDSNEMNLITFSPVTPTRRSRRLSKIS